ncbi:MAG TPA: site-2 protease family protein [Pyrinomonadaceae bacterium]|nr:site-2 protease family protein [Pyrinomonadaceae bacterium]
MKFLRFFKRQLLLAHVSGIPVRVDYRWFFVLALMSWITASGINTLTDNAFASFIFGFATTLIFFASIFLHEFAHAVAARMENMQVLEIVLHPFGGLTRFRHAPETPRAEFRVAIAGPAASFLIAILFLVLMAAFNSLGADIIARLLFTLCLLNFLLAVFNMFPGYPLDGGRVLRAYLWHRGTDLNEATVLTGRCGQIIAAVFIAFGIGVALVQADFFTGFWTILVGLFLYDAAKGIILEVRNSEQKIVEEVMQLPVSVTPEMDVLHFVDRVLSLHRRTVFPVARNKQLYGILSLEDLKKLPRDAWSKTKIQTVMRPITPDYFVEADTPLPEARELMRENGIGALGVIDAQGNLVGFLQSRKKVKK